MNTGFSWVRIDKGNIHCNFRYLDIDQVRTVINYLKTHYEYRDVTVSIVDLGADGVLKETGDHYRPSGADPAQDYYFLVELHRHGMIIPQGCVEIMKEALNAMAMNAIIPKSVFINKLKTNQLTVEDTASLTAVSTKSSGSDIVWSSSDLTIISFTPSGMDCEIVAESPGTADIIASVQVPEAEPLTLKVMPEPSSYWLDNVYQYIGVTNSSFTKDHYYECVFDNAAPKKYKWQESSYDPSTPTLVTYRDIYTLIVRTYIKILTKNIQRLCLYHFVQMEAYSPSSSLVIDWSVSSPIIGFDGGISTGSQVMIEGRKPGVAVLTASITDSYGSYVDSVPIEIFAIDITPSAIKMVTGSIKSATIAKQNIFSIDPEIVVEWTSSNTAIATVEAVNPTDAVLDFAEAQITAQGVGQAIITGIAEDPTDGTSYSDTVKITVGNVAINVPDSTTINLLESDTLEISCDLTAGFTVDGSVGWTSANPSVVSITAVSGTDNNTARLTGLAEGSAFITVTARNGAAVDTDQILIKVVNVETVTGGEMATFTHGMYNGHGVIDWNHPTGEEGTLEADESGLDLATKPEVDSFVDDLFDPGDDGDGSGHIE